MAFHQGQCWLELQHSIPSALNKWRDSGCSSSSHSHSPTAMLEQMQERLHSIVQDRFILNRSCGKKLCALPWRVRGRPRRRKGAGRGGKSMRPVTQACSDTIEESISSTDDVAPQRKRARVYKGSPPSSTTHITFNTSCHFHSSHRTIFHKCATVSWFVLNSLRLEANKTCFSNELIRLVPAPALLNTRKIGGYAGT